MHLHARPKSLSFALKTLTGALAGALFLSSAAHAAGLGKLTVLSALGQPLRAEIELTAVSNDEAGALVAKLAPPEAFRQANIEFNPALLSLRFAVEQRNGRRYIQLTSAQPVNEPFVDMLLELSWSSGRLVREYTFLLDPPELRATQPAQVAGASPVDVLTEGVRPASQAPAKPKQTRAPAAGEAPAAGAYKVRAGDTLGRIAAQLKPVDVSLDVMLVALYRANPEAFIGRNMNRLKSGQILNMPDSDALHAAEGEAHGVIVAHAADFAAYRNKLAGQVASGAPAKEQAPAQSASGKISAKVEERPTAANESKDQLKLSKAVPTAAASGKSTAASTEETIAKDRALADSSVRIKELEKNVSELEQLMALKNKAAAAAQTAPQPKPAAASVPAPVKPAPAAKKAPPPVKPAVVPPEPSLLDKLMENMTAIGAGALVLLLALFGISRRKKKEPVAPIEPSILGEPTDQPHSLFAETGGQSVDTNNSVFNSSFAPSASQLDTNEVDPVAEADVYIAYGRDAQAEEILKDALRLQPDRYPVRLKLLEIYAAREDQRAFETQAAELYALTKGQGEEWSQAAALGLSIDPLNPLYAQAVGGATAAGELSDQGLLSQQLDDALAAGATDSGALGAQADDQGAPPAAKIDDDNMLDFDLGGMSFEPISNSEPIAMPGPALAPAAASQPEPEPISSDELAFDLAFDAPAAAAPSPVSEAALVSPIDLAAIELAPREAAPSAEFDAAALDEFKLVAVDEPAKATEEAYHPLMDLATMALEPAPPPPQAPDEDPFAQFDLPVTPAAAPIAPTTFELDESFADLDLPSIAEADAPFVLPGRAGAPPQFDMSNIDLELPPTGAGSAALEDMAPAAGGGELSASQMEMETKLDLAIAYQEIGDKEGARELLDEVIKGGNAEQVSRAAGLRTALA
jgi:pilus assembly protein FimV